MPRNESTWAFAIVPTNDLAATISFWERLGFERVSGDKHYVILTGWDCEVHVTQAGEGPWSVPVEHNPFGVFIRTPHVEAIAARVDDLVIRPGGILRHRCTRRSLGSHRLAVELGWGRGLRPTLFAPKQSQRFP
ncbi:glyoxalase [Aquidulcibacter sp.]|jgi:hypothetical protein|uniref:glyoxalase n=1 Tax=Aquidulcibacter sp. TaxID=2052990 RepID=UPI0028AB9EB0|nr:glyoxalase [Aquidulcibacter sp.]